MTKREEIRKGLEEKLEATWYIYGHEIVWRELARVALEYLHENGGVLKSNFTIWDRLSLKLPASIKRHYKLCYVEPLEARDTVMSEEQLEPIYNKCVEDTHINRFAIEVAKAQAETTGEIMYDEGFTAGIKLVVEWINKHGSRNKTIKWWLCILEEDWQEFIKGR